MTEVTSVTRELFMERALPSAGLSTPTRLFTAPAHGYAVSSGLIVCNQGAATTFNVWIGKVTDSEAPLTLIASAATLGAAGAASSYIEFPGGKNFVNGGWISVSSTSGSVSFQLHGAKVTIMP